MKLSGDASVYLSVLAIALFIVGWSLFGEDYSFDSKFLPILIGGVVVLLASAGLWNEVRVQKKNEVAANMSNTFVRESWRGYFVHFGWVAGFLLGIYLIGFLLAIPIFLFTYSRRLGSRFLPALVASLTVSVFIYGAFEFGLDVKLYRGLLFSWLS